MNQTITGAAAPTPPARPPAATIGDLIRPPLTTIGQDDHLAAAAYLMKHTGTTALLVTDTHTGQPAGIITAADITRATAGGNDPNNTRVHAVMTTRPAITTTTSIHDAANIMTATHHRHLPVTSDTGLLGAIDITDICQALGNAEEGNQCLVADPGRADKGQDRRAGRRKDQAQGSGGTMADALRRAGLT